MIPFEDEIIRMRNPGEMLNSRHHLSVILTLKHDMAQLFNGFLRSMSSCRDMYFRYCVEDAGLETYHRQSYTPIKHETTRPV